MRRLAYAVSLILCAQTSLAATPDEVDRLWRALEMPKVIDTMREEGLAYGRSLDADMLEGRGGPRFTAQIERIYDADRMLLTARSAFSGAFAERNLQAPLAFFEGELGSRVIDLEIDARRAMLDPEVDAAARMAAVELSLEDPSRYELIQRFAEVNDLVEGNISGALNSNYAFFQGMAAAGALGPEMDEAGILEEVWSQEEFIRQDTIDWVNGFMTLSYQELKLEEIEAYVEFSASAPGQALNTSLFSAFDVIFNGIARQLGAAVAEELVGEEL